MRAPRQPGRRAVLAGLAAGALLPGAALAAAGDAPLRRVLFLGNSFTYEHDIPARVAALAAAAGRPVETHLLARGGATLAGHMGREPVRQTLGWGWEALVLQPHSLTLLTPEGRDEAARAIRLARALAPRAAAVLFTPWPRAAGHPLYARPGGPEDPAAMARAIAEAAVALAAGLGLSVAPVATAWAAALAEGAPLHAADGYHASPAGAALTARVLWQALAGVLP